MTLCYKTLATPFEVAHEWSIPCVGSHMGLEVSCLVKKLHAV